MDKEQFIEERIKPVIRKLNNKVMVICPNSKSCIVKNCHHAKPHHNHGKCGEISKMCDKPCELWMENK